jgi:glutathione peroxidase
MKSILSIAVLLGFLSFRPVGNDPCRMENTHSPWQDSIYSIPLSNIDEAAIDLQSFRGKKMLIVVLPLSTEDTSVIPIELSAVQSRYGDSLVVIGVPSEEFGYNSSLTQQVKDLYSTQPPGFIIAEGLKVKKASASEQSLLFQWLTDHTKNRYFDREVQGTGDKFFIDEVGQLYAVVSSQVKLSGSLVQKILSKPIAH